MFRKYLTLEYINPAEIKSVTIQKFVWELICWGIVCSLDRKQCVLTKLNISHDGVSILYIVRSFHQTSKQTKISKRQRLTSCISFLYGEGRKKCILETDAQMTHESCLKTWMSYEVTTSFYTWILFLIFYQEVRRIHPQSQYVRRKYFLCLPGLSAGDSLTPDCLYLQ